jgi:hypothetical protein
MNIFEKLTRFVKEVFKTNLEIFLEALQLSPNAQGYVSGSITELLLKKKLEDDYGFEVKRIREKWEGRKHPNHHGDFYFRKINSPWFVLESKGVKSNSEKWHSLYNYGDLKRFLLSHADKIAWIDQRSEIEPQVIAWLNKNLPKFQNEYKTTLYHFEEIQKYILNLPKRETIKSAAISALREFKREQISSMINERLKYVQSKLRVLETHFVSGVSGASQRTQATPRKDEFNAISVDIFLKYSEHKFLFANPKHLKSSGSDPNHIQQNYVIGFIFTEDTDNDILSITEDWYEDLNEVYETFNDIDAVKEEEMQIDSRRVVLIDEADVDIDAD